MTTTEDGRIRVYCRVRPTARPSPYLTLDAERGTAEWALPADGAADINNRGSHRFAFDGVFGPGASQGDVFDAVAAGAVDAALGGFNATVFAYGQTGSGKTFTVTGGAERYADRGLIPRALGRLFDAAAAAAARADGTSIITAHVSYLEIYNEVGYDLLGAGAAGGSEGSSGSAPGASSSRGGGGGGGLDGQLPRVTPLEAEDGSLHLRGLSAHRVACEEDALNLLFLGDTNRAIAETPLNQASTRSHCVFTVALEARREGSAVITRSKLHLVDLAGSERTGKTHASGLLLREATSINKSLHYLELVIGALQERRAHVPYRNSVLTAVLRDSLGGNCKTAMVATLNPEVEHTDEGVTTCRFAQRVAGVSNAAVVNTEVDPRVLIAQLRSRVAALEGEVAALRGDSGGGGGEAPANAADAASVRDADDATANVPADERAAIAAAVDAWVGGAAADASAAAAAAAPPGGARLAMGPLTPARVQVAFAALRSLVALARAGATSSAPPPAAAAPATSSSQPLLPAAPAAAAVVAKPGGGAKEVAQLRAEVARLRAALVQQQMLGMLVAATTGGGGPGPPQQLPPLPPSPACVPAPPPTPMLPTPPVICLPSGAPLPDGVLRDRDRARRAFKAAWHGAPALAENEAALQATYARAQEAAAAVNAARDATTALRAAIERRRLAAAVSEITAAGGGDAAAEDTVDEEEARLVHALQDAKVTYKARYETLRVLKGEVEGTQRVLEGLAMRLQAEFDAWYTGALVALAGAGAVARAAPPLAAASHPPPPATVPLVTTTSRPPTPLTRPVSASSLPPPPQPPQPWPPPLVPPNPWASPSPHHQQLQQQLALPYSPLPLSRPPSSHAPPLPQATPPDATFSISWALRPPPQPPAVHRYPSSDALPAPPPQPSQPLPYNRPPPPPPPAGYVLSSSSATVGEASSVDADVAAFLAAKQALLLQQQPRRAGSFMFPATG